MAKCKGSRKIKKKAKAMKRTVCNILKKAASLAMKKLHSKRRRKGKKRGGKK